MENEHDFIKQMTARMTMHEFLLEQLCARMVLMEERPHAAWQEFGKSFIEKMGQLQTSQPVPPELESWVTEQALIGQDLARRFVTKVGQRLG